ncbi:MAG: GNAT family N-acetyltransferase [Flavobacteriales bacterium]|nr:GNAT family N-acetyltransferase [Flavobacteriales bacterium]
MNSMDNNSVLFFEKLSHSTIELLRNWRNQDFVLEQMEFREIISKEAQEHWFESIKDNTNFEYYIFGIENEAIGLVNLAEINKKTKTATVGLFIGNARYIGTGIAFDASNFIIKRAFKELELETLFAKVKNSNSVAIQYNAILGFQFLKALNPEFSIYQLKLIKD